MCNLYNLTKGQPAIRDWFRAPHDRTGNLPLFPAIFPDQLAPIIRVGADGERELVMVRWGMPDDRGKRGRRAYPSQGHAGHSDEAGGSRSLASG
jgi:putative SOS response-associated peptidase YedK